jgi:hypothetical protein
MHVMKGFKADTVREREVEKDNVEMLFRNVTHRMCYAVGVVDQEEHVPEPRKTLPYKPDIRWIVLDQQYPDDIGLGHDNLLTFWEV